jgi:hypothetical protein
MGSAFTFLHFVEKVGGIEKVFHLMEDLNKPRIRQWKIAEAYRLDEGYLSRILKDYFEWKLLPAPETQLLIDHCLISIETQNGDAGRVRARIIDFATRRPADPQAHGQ